MSDGLDRACYCYLVQWTAKEPSARDVPPVLRRPATVAFVSILGWIAVGLIAGSLARWAVADDRRGCLYTLVVGVLGALIGGALMSFIDESSVNDFSLRSIVVAALGASLLLLVLQAIDGRGGSGRRR